MVILKQNMLLPASIASTQNGAEPISVNSKTVHVAVQTAFGAQRTLRNYIRRALSARLARAYISRETSVGYSHSGAPGHMDLERDLMERAWPNTEAGIGQSGWEAGRLGHALSTSAREWIEFSVSCGEDGDWQLRDGLERVLDEVAGTLKDVLQEVDARDEDNASLTKEEAVAVGQTLFYLSEYLIPLKYVIHTLPQYIN
jgi:hypothetical protein